MSEEKVLPEPENIQRRKSRILSDAANLKLIAARTELILAKAKKVKVQAAVQGSISIVPKDFVELEAPAHNNFMIAALMISLSILGLGIAVVVIGFQIISKL